jgi:superoxide dismutase, Fe-Mn family
MALELPPLPYDKSALAPFISERTLEFHHGKHHAAYVTNGNNLIKDMPLADLPIEMPVRA